jgi:hypothetical protein
MLSSFLQSGHRDVANAIFDRINQSGKQAEPWPSRLPRAMRLLSGRLGNDAKVANIFGKRAGILGSQDWRP